MRTMKFLCSVILLVMLAGPAFSQMSAADPQTLVASMTLDKKQTGEKTDREIDVVAIAADGFIQGSDGKEQQVIPFSEIAEITWDLDTHSHTVKTWAGKTHILKWGLIKSENTASGVSFKSKDPQTGNLVDENLSSADIKRLVFRKK